LHGSIFFFQAEDGIRDLVRSRGLGDVYKRQESSEEKIQLPLADCCTPDDFPKFLGDETFSSLDVDKFLLLC